MGESQTGEGHAVMTDVERMWFAHLLLTGTNPDERAWAIGEAARHDGPALYVKQRKTGVELLIPIHPELRAVLDATPSEHLTFLVTATGKPYGDNHFSESFREWCDAAGLPKRCTAHGLRKAACRRDAEAGCSANEIMAHSGHGTMKELVRYTKAADQARLARNAMTRTVAKRGGVM